LTANHKLFIQGMKISIPVIIGLIPLGFASGIVLQAAGLTYFQIALMSLLVFTGTSQYIAAGMIMLLSSPLSIGVTSFIIGIRHILYVSAILPYMNNWSMFRKLFFVTEITDETFALNSSLFKDGQSLEYYRSIGINMTAHLTWIIANTLGGVLGSKILDPKAFAIDFALPSLFIALIIPRLIDKDQLIAALLAIFLSIIFIFLNFSYWGIVLASIIASLLAFIISNRGSK